MVNDPSVFEPLKFYFICVWCFLTVKIFLSSQEYLGNGTDWRANSVDPDEVAHDEPPHLDLHCLQIQLYFISVCSFLRLLHSEQPKLYGVSTVLSAIKLKVKIFLPLQEYLGNGTVRGIPVDHWQGCGRWETNSTMLIDYYFARNKFSHF